jgi:hypothetical protein
MIWHIADQSRRSDCICWSVNGEMLSLARLHRRENPKSFFQLKSVGGPAQIWACQSAWGPAPIGEISY